MQLVQLSSSAVGSRNPRRGDAKVLGSYELVEQIAGGTFCTIHRARALVATGAPCAVVVKRLRPAHQGRQGRARLLREARVGFGLRSQNLVRVLAIHDHPELFVVMEHIEGATLHELLPCVRGVDELRFILPMFVDALRGLSALHNWNEDDSAPPRFLVHQLPTAHHMLTGVDGLTRLLDLANIQRCPVVAHADASDRAREGLDPRRDLFVVATALEQVLDHVSEPGDDGLSPSLVRAQCAALRAIVARARPESRRARYESADAMAYAIRKAAEEADLFAPPIAIGAWVRKARASATLGDQRALRNRLCLPPPPRGSSVSPVPMPLFAMAGPAIPEPVSSGRKPALSPSPSPSTADRPAIAAPRPSTPPRLKGAANVAQASATAPVAPRERPSSPPPFNAARTTTLTFRPAADSLLPVDSAHRLRRVVGVASSVALLAGVLTLSAQGGRQTGTVSAAGPLLQQTPAVAPLSELPRETQPVVVVTSLAPKPRRRARLAPARQDTPPPAEVLRAPATLLETEIAPEDPRVSTAESIAESIRAIEQERDDARRAMHSAKLRAALPFNPY